MTTNIISAMGKTNATAKQTTSIVQSAAKFTLMAGIGFLLLLFLLHFIKPEFDPSWHFISEYAIGENGWIMMIAFLLLAAGYVSLFVAIRSQISKGIWGRIGLALILISATGLAIGGIFTTDPVTTANENLTISGVLHNLGGTLGMAMPFAALLITLKLVKNPGWASAKKPLIWATVFALAGFIISFASLAAMLSKSNGTFGPDVLVGWPNRLEITGYVVWLITVAGQAIKLFNSKN